MKGPLGGIWEYRGLVLGLVRRELRVRSLRAAWGNAWIVIQPALQILIYTLVFSRVLAAKLPGNADPLAYGLYLCAGILPWTYFVDLITRSQTLFLENAHLLKAIRFPRSTLPAAMVATATLHFAIISTIFLAVLLATGRWPGIVLIGALPLLAVWVSLAIGIGVLCGTLNVFFRDIGYATGVVLQFWFWLTPIVYPVSIVPERLRGVFSWNPLLPVITGLQRIVIEHAWPDWQGVAVAAALGAALVLVGWGAFRALDSDLIDEL